MAKMDHSIAEAALVQELELYANVRDKERLSRPWFCLVTTCRYAHGSCRVGIEVLSEVSPRPPIFELAVLG
jgi:hypothetical protein